MLLGIELSTTPGYLQLQYDAPGLSIPQSGAFVGFSIEMSVANQICE
jgi:hypothetical protein